MVRATEKLHHASRTSATWADLSSMQGFPLTPPVEPPCLERRRARPVWRELGKLSWSRRVLLSRPLPSPPRARIPPLPSPGVVENPTVGKCKTAALAGWPGRLRVLDAAVARERWPRSDPCAILFHGDGPPFVLVLVFGLAKPFPAHLSR